MTNQSKAAGADAPQPVILDAVAAHLRRRATTAENEALGLALAVRDLDAQLQAAFARIAELEQREIDHG